MRATTLRGPCERVASPRLIREREGRCRPAYPFWNPKSCSFRQPSVTTNSLLGFPKASRPLPRRCGWLCSASVTQSKICCESTSSPRRDTSGLIWSRSGRGRKTGWGSAGLDVEDGGQGGGGGASLVRTLGYALQAHVVVELVLDDGQLLEEARVGTRRLHGVRKLSV